MGRQLIYSTAICVVLFLCATANANEDVGDMLKIRNQLLADVFILKEYVERLLTDVEVLNKKSNSQMNLLKEMNSQTANQEDNNGVCDRISGYFNSTFRKYNMFEERVITKLEEIQDEQSVNLNKILIRQNLSKNCQQSSALEVMTEALTEMDAKIDKFETQLKTFETLEVKLKEQESRAQTLNDEQMKILKEINEKLTLHQEKFENFEKQLPDLIKVTKNIGDLAARKKNPALPMSVILGLSQDSQSVKTTK